MQPNIPQGATGPFPADHWGRGFNKAEVGACTVKSSDVGKMLASQSNLGTKLTGQGVEPLETGKILEG